MNFIKKIFDRQIDNEVHLQFQKFGRGEFKNRALIEVKKQVDGYKIKTSSEFANELVAVMAGKLGERKTEVSGSLFTTLGIEIDCKKKKKSPQGVIKYIIEKEMSGKEILELLEKFPKCFFALSFSVDGDVLKIKAKAPKSGKPKNKEEEPKADFCSLKTSEPEIGKSLVFEKSGFHSAVIKHNFLIDKIEIPDELKNSKDFAKIREDSKRVGKIIREAVIDGEKIISEAELLG